MWTPVPWSHSYLFESKFIWLRSTSNRPGILTAQFKLVLELAQPSLLRLRLLQMSYKACLWLLMSEWAGMKACSGSECYIWPQYRLAQVWSCWTALQLGEVVGRVCWRWGGDIFGVAGGWTRWGLGMEVGWNQHWQCIPQPYLLSSQVALHGDSLICTCDISGVDLRSPIGVTEVLAGVRGNSSLYPKETSSCLPSGTGCGAGHACWLHQRCLRMDCKCDCLWLTDDFCLDIQN